MQIKTWRNKPEIVTYVGWNDKTRSVLTNTDLGRGVRCKHNYGFRRAVWDAAFGYVNGFQKRDILYYVLTRSLSKRVCKYVLYRNERTGKWRGDHAVTLDLNMKQHCLETGNSY